MENKIKWVKLWTQKHHDALLKISREDAGDILQNIIRYASGEPLSEMSPVCGFVFEYVRQDIDSSVRIYENKVDIARENGKNGGRPPKEKTKKKEVPRHGYGEYKNVLLSDEELEKLNAEFTENKVSETVDKMSSWMKAKGRAYTDYAAAIRNWIKNDGKDQLNGGNNGSAKPREEQGETFAEFDIEKYLE